MTAGFETRSAATLAALGGLVGLLVGAALYFGFVADDAYISFVYARNLAEHGTPVFNAGTANPVEGYTNFSWVALLALLSLVGVAPEIAAPVLGIACSAGTLLVAFAIGERRFGRDSPWALVAPALLATSAGFACWASGGLETQLFVLLLALAGGAYERGLDDSRALRRVGWLLALAALTRPEGLLVAGIFGGHRLVRNAALDKRLRPSRDELVCLGWFFAVWLPYFAWRWSYYGYPLPNTFYVKAGDGADAYRAELWSAGWYYVVQWAKQSGALWGAPLAILGAWSWRRGLGSAGLMLSAGYLAYAVSVGGDFMGLFRFVMPVFLWVALLAAAGARRLSVLGARAPLWARAIGFALLGALLFGHVAVQAQLAVASMRPGSWRSDRGIDTPAFLDVYARDRLAIGRHMKPCMRPDDFAIFGGAGAKPYAGRMRGIDVFGLVSERVAHEVPPTRARPGHNKWAPDTLLAELEPTFVFSCYDIHRQPDAPRFNCDPRFWLQRGYQRVTLQIPGLVERGEYYSFFARRERAFSCAGQVEPVPPQ